MALVPARIGFGGAPVVRLDCMGGPSERRKKTRLLMADRFKTISRGVKLSTCVFFDMITHASGSNEEHQRRIVFVHRGEKCIYDCRFFWITFSAGGENRSLQPDILIMLRPIRRGKNEYSSEFNVENTTGGARVPGPIVRHRVLAGAGR